MKIEEMKRVPQSAKYEIVNIISLYLNPKSIFILADKAAKTSFEHEATITKALLHVIQARETNFFCLDAKSSVDYGNGGVLCKHDKFASKTEI